MHGTCKHRTLQKTQSILLAFVVIFVSPSHQLMPANPTLGRIAPLVAHSKLSARPPPRVSQGASRRNARLTALPVFMKGRDSIFDKVLDVALGGQPAGDILQSGEGGGYCVIVDDDDDHTIQEVAKILRSSTSCSWKEALDRTLRIGNTGNAVVYRGERGACEAVERQLVEQALKVRVEVSSPNNSEEAEELRAKELNSLGASSKNKEKKGTWGERVFRGGGKRPRVVFIGGTGRVGMSTIRELVRMTKGDIDLVIAGRRQNAAERLMKQLRGNSFVTGGRDWATMRTVLVGNVEFVRLELTDDDKSLQSAMKDADLVVHTAGPFQGAQPQVLRAAIATGTTYMDVCDDSGYAQLCRQLDQEAKAAGVKAVTTCGIYPGLSNVMAAALVRKVKADTGINPKSLEFSYFTAGTGGVGGTILASTFLLMAEDVEVIEEGERVSRKPLSLQKRVDFGPAIGPRRTMLLNLPEVLSLHAVTGVENVSAFFGTAPDFWNLLLLLIVKVVPASLLGNQEFASNFAAVSLPVNRFVDALVGSAAGIRVDVKDESNGTLRTALWTGKYLSTAVGRATAAMALELLETQAELASGVWYPEEVTLRCAKSEQRFLSRATKGAIDWQI